MITKKNILTGLATLVLITTMGATKVASADQITEGDKTYHVVEKGDTLSDIGFKYGLDYKKIFTDNKNIIEDINLIFVGQKLLLNDLDPNKVVEQSEYVMEEVYIKETYAEEYVEPEYTSQGAPAGGSGVLNAFDGVNINAQGVYETYYSQKVLAGGGLNIHGRHVGEYDTVRDGDGYIVIASDVHPKGTIVETSLGTGKVYDTGVGHGGIDIYTNW